MSQKIICFYDCHNNLIHRYNLTALPLREETVINKSIELFNDSEPCIIHRTFVAKKLYMEIDDYLSQVQKSGYNKILWSQIPQHIHNMLDIKGEVLQVEIV